VKYKSVIMGQFSDVPRDVLWLILKHAIYADHLSHVIPYLVAGCKINLGLMTSCLMNVIRRYAQVNQRFLSVLQLKIRRVGCGWEFIDGAWSDFKP
jgi:hypothetical protein